MRRKIIDAFSLRYLNDLFEIKLIFYERVVDCNFLNLYGRYVLKYKSFFNNFHLVDATDRSKISSDQKRLFFSVSLCPLLFFANTPFKLKSRIVY